MRNFICGFFWLFLLLFSISFSTIAEDSVNEEITQEFDTKQIDLRNSFGDQYVKLAQEAFDYKLYDLSLGIIHEGKNALVFHYGLENLLKSLEKESQETEQANDEKINPKVHKRRVNEILKKKEKLKKNLVKDCLNLAQWCETVEHLEGAQFVYDIALRADPTNKKLRKSLGQQHVFPYGWMGKEERAKLNNGFIPVNGGWFKKKDIFSSDKKHNTWATAWEIQSEHFILRSDLPFKQVFEMLEQLENQYEKFYKEIGDEMGLTRGKNLLFYLFSDVKDYNSHVRICWLPAIEMGGYNGNCKHIEFNHYQIDPENDKLSHFWDSDQNYRSMPHEAVHHYLSGIPRDHKNRGPHYGIILMEGIATYYEPPAKGKNLNMLLETCKRMIQYKNTLPLNDFFPMTVKEFQSSKDKKTLYSQAAGLTHFFLNAKKGKYRSDFIKLIYKSYAKTYYPGTFEKVFGKKPQSFEKEWFKYMSKLNK